MSSDDVDNDLQSFTQNLDENKRNVLQHFQEIAGLPVSECIQVLEEHNWDLSATVEFFMGLSNSPNTTNNRPVEAHPQILNDRNIHFDFNEVRNRIGNNNPISPPISTSPSAPLPTVHVDVGSLQIVRNERPLTTWGYWQSVVFTPFYFVFYIFRDIWRLFAYLFWSPRLSASDPRGDVCLFVDNFLLKYCGNNNGSSLLSSSSQLLPSSSSSATSPSFTSVDQPPFFRNTYSEALRRCKNELKPLIAYIHEDDNPIVDEFCRSVLCHPAFINYASQNAVLWGCHRNSFEGQRVYRVLHEPPYPCFIIVILKGPINSGKMTLVGRVQGFDMEAINNDGYEVYIQRQITSIDSIIRSNDATLRAARAERQDRHNAQLLRQQQDREYEESQRIDEERFRAREHAAATYLAETHQKELQSQLKCRARERVAATIPPEFTCPNTICSSNEDFIRIMLRLPNGKRMEYCYPKQVSSKVLFLSVFAMENAPENFELCMNYPKRTIECAVKALQSPIAGDLDIESIDFWSPSVDNNDPPSFEDLKFSKKETILVIDLDA